VWAVLELIAANAPMMLVYAIGLIAAAILLSLMISLRKAGAEVRPEIIRALADLMHFWRKR
jgi:hypothetical protein